MDGVAEKPDRGEYLTALAVISERCNHALTSRMAKRFSTRDALKSLRDRSLALMKREDARGWDEEFTKLFATANAVFDQLLAEAGSETKH